MGNKEASKRNGEFSFQPVIKYIVYFYLLTIFIAAALCCLYSFSVMKSESTASTVNAKAQIDSCVAQSVSLLNSLAQNPALDTFPDTYAETAAMLNRYSSEFGYLMIRYVDKDVNVWNEKGLSASLASRDYMQRLFTTGELQVTDSFAAGADGVTLNYTVAVPIVRNGDLTGCLFTAIYFDKVEEMLDVNRGSDYNELYLLGSQNQIMSGGGEYGQTYLQASRNSLFPGGNARQHDENMYSGKSGGYWELYPYGLAYVSYDCIENTSWTVLSRIRLWGVVGKFVPIMMVLLTINTLVCLLMVLLARRYIKTQMPTIDMLVQSVQELEKKIYQNEKPDNVDFKEIISLTGKGLTDGLTGVITRTVFLNQIPNRLKLLNPDKPSALCFVDVDNLKLINDTYGHGVGDMTLKNVGYILREYEKKYNGLVGRHGGDEFILLVSDLDSRAELDKLLAELTQRLHSGVSDGNATVQTQCSIGVAVCTGGSRDVESMIEQADEALYSVKQNGKGFYKVYGE